MIKQLSQFTRSSKPTGAQGEGSHGYGGSAAEEDDEDRSRNTLEKSIRSRDTSISAMEKKRLEKEQELAGLQKELEEERLKQMEEAILHRLEADRLQRQTLAMEERLEALERDMQDKEAIHEYANLIKGVAPKSGVDSQYVMKLQSQLAKAVKKMEATSQQMELVEQSCNEVVTSLKAEIAEIVEDRCRTELELRKQLELLEEQKVDMQKDYDEQIKKNQQEMERLKNRAAAEGTEIDLKKELEEAETRLETLTQTHEMQSQTIQQLSENLQNVQKEAAAASAQAKAEASLEAKEVAMAMEALEVALEEQAGGDEEVVIDGEMASEEGGTGQEEAHIEDKK
jgi:chromosome segregation ATPase